MVPVTAILDWNLSNSEKFWGSGVAVKLNFQQYIQRYTSPNENCEYNYTLI